MNLRSLVGLLAQLDPTGFQRQIECSPVSSENRVSTTSSTSLPTRTSATP